MINPISSMLINSSSQQNALNRPTCRPSVVVPAGHRFQSASPFRQTGIRRPHQSHVEDNSSPQMPPVLLPEHFVLPSHTQNRSLTASTSLALDTRQHHPAPSPPGAEIMLVTVAIVTAVELRRIPPCLRLSSQSSTAGLQLIAFS